MEKELTLLVGIQFVGKNEWMRKNYFGKAQQIINYESIELALIKNGIQADQNVFPFVGTMARSIMMQGLPVVVCGLNITIESLHIWKKMCFEYQYKFKIVVFDEELETALKGMEDRKLLNDDNKKVLETNYEMLQELKTVLKMKHQKIADDISYVVRDVYDAKSEDKKDEILQD